ncbi:MAG: hypothetical protein GY697_21790 [Desulfobacterales bacterium]|nr:hypothetical protein [Desulfobacterales bacterium]
MNADKGKLTSELNDRLDDLFSEAGAPLESEPEAPQAAPVDAATESGNSSPASHKESPLIELNAIVLSLDWEITDENLDKLLHEIERLKTLYKESRLPYMFLQLHGSVGKYIASKKVDAHPDSIKLLHSVHAGLERVLTNPDMDETEKKKILSEEVKKFKGLKHEIMLTKNMDTDEVETLPARKTLASATVPSPTGVSGSNHQAFIDEIKNIIQTEFKELRKEIMSWKDAH